MRTPPVVADRDVVFSTRVTADPNARTARFSLQSLQDARKPPRSGLVRMNTLSGYFLLERMDAQHTRVTYQALADPGGAIPNFVTNWVLRSVPIQILRALHHEAGVPGAKCAPARAEMQRLLAWDGTFDSAALPSP